MGSLVIKLASESFVDNIESGLPLIILKQLQLEAEKKRFGQIPLRFRAEVLVGSTLFLDA